jgi:hypothetical protein
MGVPTLEVGYISATTGRGDHEVHKGHVVALEKKLMEKNNVCSPLTVRTLWRGVLLNMRGSELVFSSVSRVA